MILTFCNQKGGVGKTTLCLSILLALELTGKKVGFLDLDPQASLTQALDHLREHDFSKIEKTTSMQGFDAVVIDTPPVLNEQTAKAVQMSNKAFLVTSPSPADVWSSRQTFDFIKKHSKKSSNVKILFNSVDGRTRLARNMQDKAALIGGDYLRQTIPRTSEYQYMFLQGLQALNQEHRAAIIKLALEIVQC